MHRRRAIQTLLSAGGLAVAGCAPPARLPATDGLRVMTVNGWIDAAALGVTLPHEHLFADLRPHAEQAAQPLKVDIDEAVQVLLPQLQRVARHGCRSLVECTATNLGRHPRLIQRLSQASGLHMLANLPACVGYISLVVLMLQAAGDAYRGRVMGARMLAIYGLPVGLLGQYTLGQFLPVPDRDARLAQREGLRVPAGRRADRRGRPTGSEPGRPPPRISGCVGPAEHP